MKFIKNETISIPFTALYPGYIADFGNDPNLYVNLFDEQNSQLIDTDTFMDLQDFMQVSTNVLFIGTAYLNKLQNHLPLGNYAIRIGISTESSFVDMLYIPIEIVDPESQFSVLMVGRESLSSDIISRHLRGLIPEGVRIGFNISRSSESFRYNVGRGILYTNEGVKIELPSTAENAFDIQVPALENRVDTVCVYYDRNKIDEMGSVRPPEFRVLKGIEDGSELLASVPPSYTVIAYATIPAGVADPDQIKFSTFRRIQNSRPVFNMQPNNLPDGIADIFTFPIKFLPNTSIVDIDGSRKYPEEDYIELPNILGRSAIQFISGIPTAGQRISMSASTGVGVFYEPDYILPGFSSQPAPEIPAYTRSGLVSEFLAATLQPKFWPDTSGTTSGFRQDDLEQCPLLGWDGNIGNYAYFDGTRTMEMLDMPILRLSQYTIVIKGDFRDAPISGNWMRFLTKQTGSGDPSFSLIGINNSFNPELRFYGGLTTSPAVMDDETFLQPLNINNFGESPLCKIICSRSLSGDLTLKYYSQDSANTATVVNNSPTITYSSLPWVLGGETGVGAGGRLYGKLTLVLFYDRLLSEPEMLAI